MSNSISSRIAALESRNRDQGLTYIVTDASGDVLLLDQERGEPLPAFQRRVRDEWLAGGHTLQSLPPECQHITGDEP
ncbi:MAG: hypothetical protein JNL87_01130 [Burkholderiaceae bacterium]|nr:hypothetical protein [Burkholderiaceae bacterium]